MKLKIGFAISFVLLTVLLTAGGANSLDAQSSPIPQFYVEPRAGFVAIPPPHDFIGQ